MARTWWFTTYETEDDALHQRNGTAREVSGPDPDELCADEVWRPWRPKALVFPEPRPRQTFSEAMANPQTGLRTITYVRREFAEGRNRRFAYVRFNEHAQPALVGSPAKP